MRLCFCKSGARKRLLLSEHEKFEKARNKYSAMNVSMMLIKDDDYVDEENLNSDDQICDNF